MLFRSKGNRSYARSLLVQRMQEKGCRILVDTKVESVYGDELTYSCDGKMTTLTGIDTVVCALGVCPNNSLSETVKKLGIPLYIAGDAMKTGRIYEAITSGEALASQI